MDTLRLPRPYRSLNWERLAQHSEPRHTNPCSSRALQSPWELYTRQISSHPPPTLRGKWNNMTKIGIKYNQQHAISDHATIRRSTSNPETSLPEFTKTIILQKIKAYEEKQSARQALRRLVKITTSETKPGEKPPLRINTELEFKVEIRRKTPSSSQESSPHSSKHSSDDGTASDTVVYPRLRVIRTNWA